MPTAPSPYLLPTTSTSSMPQQKKSPMLSSQKQNYRRRGWQTRICPPSSAWKHPGDSKKQRAGCARAPLPPSILAPLRLGKGKGANCSSMLILGQISRGLGGWQGRLFKGHFAAGAFHASLSREFAATPSKAMPEASSRPRLQGLILPFRVMK